MDTTTTEALIADDDETRSEEESPSRGAPWEMMVRDSDGGMMERATTGGGPFCRRKPSLCKYLLRIELVVFVMLMVFFCLGQVSSYFGYQQLLYEQLIDSTSMSVFPQHLTRTAKQVREGPDGHRSVLLGLGPPDTWKEKGHDDKFPAAQTEFETKFTEFIAMRVADHQVQLTYPQAEEFLLRFLPPNQYLYYGAMPQRHLNYTTMDTDAVICEIKDRQTQKQKIRSASKLRIALHRKEQRVPNASDEAPRLLDVSATVQQQRQECTLRDSIHHHPPPKKRQCTLSTEWQPFSEQQECQFCKRLHEHHTFVRNQVEACQAILQFVDIVQLNGSVHKSLIVLQKWFNRPGALQPRLKEWAESLLLDDHTAQFHAAKEYQAHYIILLSYLWRFVQAVNDHKFTYESFKEQLQIGFFPVHNIVTYCLEMGRAFTRYRSPIFGTDAGYGNPWFAARVVRGSTTVWFAEGADALDKTRWFNTKMYRPTIQQWLVGFLDNHGLIGEYRYLIEPLPPGNVDQHETGESATPELT